MEKIKGVNTLKMNIVLLDNCISFVENVFEIVIILLFKLILFFFLKIRMINIIGKGIFLKLKTAYLLLFIILIKYNLYDS